MNKLRFVNKKLQEVAVVANQDMKNVAMETAANGAG